MKDLPSSLERDAALNEMEKITKNALSFRGNQHAQRIALAGIERNAARAGMAPLDWLEWYFTKSTGVRVESVSEEIHCDSCGRTFANLYAYNGHAPTKCRLKKISGR